MIAKFTLAFICLFTVDARANFLMAEEVMKTYISKAGYHNVHPPKSKLGYPIWYQAEASEHPKVIFLRHGLFEKIVKLNDSSYVAEPTKEYAYTIFKFSGEYEANPVVYIIPDSSITHYELRDFCDELSSYLEKVRFNLVSSDLTYFPLQWLNFEGIEDYDMGCGWGLNLFSLKMNSREEMLIDGQRKLLQHVEPKTYEQYSLNINACTKMSAFDYRLRTYSEVIQTIDKLEELYEEHPRDFHFRDELIKWRKVKWWTKKYTSGEFIELNNWDMTDVEIFGNTMEVSYYYDILGEYYQGLKRFRNEQCNQQFLQSYDNLLCTGQFEKVRFLDFQIKHNVTRVKLPRIEPVPVIELPDIPEHSN